ncbi:hypothetical protein ACFL6I_05595, partial [candidate division KSB1 bacterium]
MTEGEKLPTEYVYGQDILKNRIKKLDKQSERGKIKKILTGAGKRDPNALKTTCQSKLDQLKSPIETPEQFRTAVDEVNSFNITLSTIRSVDLSQEHIGDLLNSDISAFFGDKLFKRLDNTAKRMATADSALNTAVSATIDSTYTTTATLDWGKKGGEKDRLNSELRQLKQERKVLKKNKKPSEDEVKKLEDVEDMIRNTKEALRNETNWKNRRAAQLQAEREEMEERNKNQTILKSGKADDKILEAMMQDESYKELYRQSIEDRELQEKRQHRLTYQFEGWNIAALADKMSYEDKLELTNVLLELREIKHVEIFHYLKGKQQVARKKFIEMRAKKRFSEEKISDDIMTASEIEQDLNKAERIFLNKENLFKLELDDSDGPERLLAKVNSINAALDQQLGNLNHIEERAEFISEVKKDSEGTKAQVRAQFAEVKSKINLLTPEVLDALSQMLDEAGSEQVGYEKLKDGLGAVKNKESMLAEMEAQIEKMDSMSPEELFAFKAELDQKQELCSRFNGDKIQQALHPDVKIAHDLIEQLEEYAQKKSESGSPEKVKDIEKILGDRLVYVSGAKFKKECEESETGFMVIDFVGDKWEIIVNRDAKNKLKDGAKFREQITHELLHVQYEKDPETKKKCHELFIENKNWAKIKQAFVNTFPKKRPPTYQGEKKEYYEPDDWPHDAVMSEIFAMQNDIFKENSPYQELKEAIKDAKIDSSGLGDARDAALRYGIDHEHYRLGAESGEDGMKEITSSSDSGGDLGGEGEYVSSTEENAQEIEKNNERMQALYDSGCIGHIPGAGNLLGIMKDYNEDTAKMNDKLKVTRNSAMSKLIDERIKRVKDDVGEIEQDMAEINEKMPNNMISPFRHVWNSTTFCSAEDFWQVALDFKEWWERRHKRKTADHAAKLGMAVFENLPVPIISEFGTEASAREQKAESEEVNEWKSRLENKDAWELIATLKQMAKDIDPNKDQLKAILRILAEKGRIDWREPAIWLLLSKMQNAVSLSPSDDIILKNPILLRQKLHAACGEIWDYDEFLKLERDNESNYDGGKQKYMGSLDKIQDQLTARLDQLLRKHREGENVDPQEYEAIMEYCITKGKSYAENVMFHLMAGMAEGLLPPDRGLSLDKFLNQWPATQWIYEQAPPLTKKDYVW